LVSELAKIREIRVKFSSVFIRGWKNVFMKLLAVSLLVFVTGARVFAGDVTPADRVDLFNGKDFSGWTFCLKSNAAPEKTFVVTNGVIHCTGRPAGYARTEKTFRNYKLTVEWRFVKIAPRADNSGIFVHVNPPDKVWPTCIEIQGQHGHQGDLRMNGSATAKGHESAATKNADAQAPSNENPVGEWNTLVAECRGDAIRLSTNGKFANEITGCSVTSGAIGIQSEGGEIEVRKIFVEPPVVPLLKRSR
jgi:hypothetical protein